MKWCLGLNIALKSLTSDRLRSVGFNIPKGRYKKSWKVIFQDRLEIKYLVMWDVFVSEYIHVMRYLTSNLVWWMTSSWWKSLNRYLSLWPLVPSPSILPGFHFLSERNYGIASNFFRSEWMLNILHLGFILLKELPVVHSSQQPAVCFFGKPCFLSSYPLYRTWLLLRMYSKYHNLVSSSWFSFAKLHR